MIQQWWASSHDDPDPVMKRKKMTWKLEDKEYLKKKKMTWRLEDEEDLKRKKMTWRLKEEEDSKMKKTWRWRDDPVDAEKKTSAENCVERIPS